MVAPWFLKEASRDSLDGQGQSSSNVPIVRPRWQSELLCVSWVSKVIPTVDLKDLERRGDTRYPLLTVPRQTWSCRPTTTDILHLAPMALRGSQQFTNTRTLRFLAMEIWTTSKYRIKLGKIWGGKHRTDFAASEWQVSLRLV